MLESEDTTELMIRLGMPVAAAGSVFLLTFLGLLFAMDRYIFNLDLGSPLLLVVTFGLNLSGSYYCFNYARNKLGYFGSKDNKLRHFLLLVVLPIFLGAAFGFRSYQAKMVSYKVPHHTENLKNHEK